MKPITKTMIKTFLLTGLFFGGGMAGFDYKDGKDFSLVGFIVRGSFYGTSMALMTWYGFKKKEKAKQGK